MEQNKASNTVTPLYMILGVTFTACLLISNLVANRMFQFGPWSLTSGVIIFPLSYIIGDVVAEVYGFKAARRVMWLGFLMNALMVVLFAIILLLPVPGWYQDAPAYRIVLGNTPRLFLASMAAYLIGSWVNAASLSKLKVAAAGKGFGFRAAISTLLGEIVDSLIFVPIGFFGLMPFNVLIEMAILQVTFKTLYEILVLPITSIVVAKVKAYDKIDVVDHGVSYKLFG